MKLKSLFAIGISATTIGLASVAWAAPNNGQTPTPKCRTFTVPLLTCPAGNAPTDLSGCTMKMTKITRCD